MIWSTRLTEDYAIDVAILEQVRAWADGIDFVGFQNALHLYREDHHPRWEFRFDVFNWCLLSVDVYNVHHAEPEAVPMTRSQEEEALG